MCCDRCMATTVDHKKTDFVETTGVLLGTVEKIYTTTKDAATRELAENALLWIAATTNLKVQP